MRTELRPIERRVLSLLDAGVEVPEVARRFHRSAAHISRLAEFARLEGRHHVAPTTALRAIERRVLDWRAQGASHAAIADRFKRSEASTERIEALANYELAR